MITAALPEAQATIIGLLADGFSRADMARRLGVPETTVVERLRRLYTTLGVHDRGAAVAVAYRAGILNPGEGVVSPQVDALPAANPPLVALARARENAGLTQAAVAAELGISRSALSYRENGVKPFTVGEVRRYAELVGVDLGGAA